MQGKEEGDGWGALRGSGQPPGIFTLTCGASFFQPLRAGEIDIVQTANPDGYLRIVFPVSDRQRRHAACALPGAPCVGESALDYHTK